MDISNSVQITPVAPNPSKTNSIGSNGLRPSDSVRPNDAVSRNDNARPTDDSRSSRQEQNPPQARLAAPEDLEKRSNEIQFNKIQRSDSLDSAPLRNQQAVNTYQQTVDAGKEYLEGELVGVDLFV